MTSAAKASALIAESLPLRPIAKTAIADSVDRVLAEAIRAERDQPPFDRVTMDGIAVASSAWADGIRSFAIAGVQAAGVEPLVCPAHDACIRVMTGAVRPEGTDAVIPVERVRIDGDRAAVDASAVVEPGRFIHARGSDRKCGETVLEPGVRLGPAEIAVLASAGYATVATAVPARIAIVSTGDELVAVDAAAVAPFQIRSSNDLAIEASLRRSHLADCSRTTLPDDSETILAAVSELHEDNDILILSGGVSMGDFDFVPAVLEKLDATVVFHRIEQKPGRPMWFGLSGAGKPIFALPGNPVSTLLCMTRYVVPALAASLSLRPAPAEFARLSKPVSGPADMTYFVPVILSWSDDGIECALPRPTNTSGDFASLAATDGFIELPSGRGNHPIGTIGRIYRW